MGAGFLNIISHAKMRKIESLYLLLRSSNSLIIFCTVFIRAAFRVT
jgi:hypothetical protein